ncbi:hypothetical protein KAU40_02220 [Candidatus Parcubacteria bacterium]|nr:hypothetical protein [Candidatus Parcubacteria bacterium]
MNKRIEKINFPCPSARYILAGWILNLVIVTIFTKKTLKRFGSQMKQEP